MASNQSISLLARARSARLAPNTNNKQPPVNSSTGGGAPIPGPSSTSSSNVSLFLTNLRLLDLDSLPDWPDINPLTFTNKDLAQGQKKRIQSVEWALYQLFDLWDAEETRNKLKPFFPPLDQLQSTNLRAALLRCLEQAKKNGVLGRDAVVRRTMLDDCKGERLEEVLATFSSAVLKKMVSEASLNGKEHLTIAETLALENRGYSGDTAQITALVLAHRASLSKTLRERREARGRYKDLAQLLDLKERGISRRKLQLGEVKAHAADGMSEDEKLALWRAVRNNWAGNERWMEALLYGDAPRDGLLTAPFDRVWRRVQSGRLAELEEHCEPGLIEQLDGRVKMQKERLQKWQTFRRDMFGTDLIKEDRAQKRKSLTLDHVAKPRGIDLGFGAHENIRYGTASPMKLAAKPQSLKPEYKALVDDLQEELDSINKGQSNPFAGGLQFVQRIDMREAAALHATDLPEESTFKHVDLEEDSAEAWSASNFARPSESYMDPPHKPSTMALPEKKQNKRAISYSQPVERKSTAPKPEVERTVSERPKSLVLDQNTRLPSTAGARTNKPPLSARNVYSSGPADAPAANAPSKRPAARPRTPSPPPAPRHTPEERPIEPPQPVVSQTQREADAILASISAASPSPEKKPRHTLSLAERTRLSMVRDVNEGEDEELDRLSLKRRGSTSGKNKRPVAEGTMDGNAAIPEEDEAEDDLVARTRRSMANFEATRQKVQLERRRSQRKAARESNVHQQHRRNGGGSISAMPSTLEEGAAEGDSVLVDQMLEQGVDDYEAVFKSRPKIQTSPRLTAQ
ncbi:hypothetical protein MCOR27_000003 [Pyricularia oryzae]|nr:hypothetical protein MCOR01_002802 [Pyricularia oryzae]KAI6289510.1 hypothetical protein MCOR27_000003 [Pyricularia oryzae]KAI6330795.1 hypothetical protein MCOR29_001739 [Pyricularia oryzae]KAI6359186.1 hypothetical protein MCOR31_009536 [Pyricularia oryzae]KAI6409115.1 hypothetical protein MCOR24_007310 [Pyricularia oryzae]